MQAILMNDYHKQNLYLNKGDKVKILWDEKDYLKKLGNEGIFVGYTSCGTVNQWGFKAQVKIEGYDRLIILDQSKLQLL